MESNRPLLRSAATLLALIAIALVPARAVAKTYQPPKGKVFAGTSDTGQGSDYREYRDQTRAHPAVMQSFESWGYMPKEAIRRWADAHTRGMLSLSTARCYGCPGVISLKSIAKGKGDRYLLSLARALDKRKRPTYIRLFPEMNGHWNPYSAFEADGSPRHGNSTKMFRKAWRRVVIILRGGKRKQVDRRLSKLKMPKVKGRTAKRLPNPKVAFAWVPQTAGSPNVSGNAPRNYFPGYSFVDWVGADIYGKYPNFSGLSSFYSNYNKRPFMIGEWSAWDIDSARFVSQLFNWVESRKRAKMLVYYQDFGEGTANAFEVTDYPAALKRLRHRLNDPRYVPFVAGEGKGSKKTGKGKRKRR